MSGHSRGGEGPYDLAVIGGGTAGLVTAAGAAGIGARVALVERRAMGGDCLNFGCVPSKALIAASKVAHAISRAPQFGLGAAPRTPRLDCVFERMRERRAAIAPHDSEERFSGLGVDVLRGEARLSPQGMTIDGREVRARRVVLATGSRAFLPAIPGLEAVPFHTNETFFDDLPGTTSSLLVLGGGPIGCELAQAMSRLGVEVTLVEALPRLLPREDPEVGPLLARVLEAEGVRVLTGAAVASFEQGASGVVAQLKGGGTVRGDALLVAVGRRPNVEGLGLEEAGVRHSTKGVMTDRFLRTSNPRVFACGDLVGPYAFTHTADHQARVVVRNALLPRPFWKPQDLSVVPRVTFTDPEVAQAGLTEEEARQAGAPFQVHRVSWEDVDRSVLEREETGFVKVLSVAGGRILGATLMGPHAGELLHELVVAMGAGATLPILSSTIHAYPTLSSALQKAADDYQRRRLTPFARRALGWMMRLAP